MLKIADGDSALWQSFKKGDLDSFQTIYFQYYSHLNEYGMRLISDREAVEDCIHDLFVKLWNNKANLADVITIKPYLLVALRTTIFNRLQHSSHKQVKALSDDHPFEMVFSVESELIEKESYLAQKRQISEALNQLTPRQKEVIYLRYFEELSYEEIATTMDITVKATYKLAARGIEALRNILGGGGLTFLLFIAKTDLKPF